MNNRKPAPEPTPAPKSATLTALEGARRSLARAELQASQAKWPDAAEQSAFWLQHAEAAMTLAQIELAFVAAKANPVSTSKDVNP